MNVGSIYYFYIYVYPKTSWTKNSSRLALCANSLQNFWDVERIESLHTSVMVRLMLYYIAQMGIVNARLIFYEWLNYKKFSLAVSPHHLAKCVICIFAKFVCFSRIRENTKTRKMTFSHICKIVKNSKKFSYTWFISPRIIYCLVPRQPPTWPFGGGGYNHGDPSRKVHTFRDVEILLNLDCVHLHVHTIFHKFLFYKNYFYKIYFIYFF